MPRSVHQHKLCVAGAELNTQEMYLIVSNEGTLMDGFI